ncbi:hypothetical protein PVAG01_04408 [Phlyctema vagabunda]|uniref:CorA-like transporter domain-containing protein n=1 Tax=Phlyctema vagabunda TaxID=108571 RepID=A0ABR4PP41_9HELO
MWIVVKGSHLIRQRVQETIADLENSSGFCSFKSTVSSFTSTLATHLVLCDWCDENWRWYLAFLETRLQDLTQQCLNLDIPKASSFVAPNSFQKVEQPSSILQRTWSDITKHTTRTLSKRSTSSGVIFEKTMFQPSFPQPPAATPQSPDEAPRRLFPPVLPPGVGDSKSRHHADKDELYSATTLQEVQVIEEKLNQVILVLKSNTKIVQAISEHYQSVMNSNDCPSEISSGCRTAIAHFKRRIENIIGDLEIQYLSADMLLRLLQTRKGLLSGLLNRRDIEANKELSVKSQYYAKKMEEMAEAMHLLAVKTKQETVSMRVITLVTLFFLPGTFISTVMSTDIIQFPPSQELEGKVFQLKALQLYIFVTVPLMVITFATWGLIYWWVNRRQDFKMFGGHLSGWNS